MQPMNDFKPVAPEPSAEPGQSNTRQEVRCAVRFPLTLPVVLATGEGELAALSRNVSASGVLFELDQQLPTGADIRFSLRMPGEVLGTLHDVLVHCLGRVVRCSLSQTHYLAAATIDEYQFAEQ
jgi:PilZ domain-containing protein